MLTILRRHALLFRTVLKNSLMDQDPPREWPLMLCKSDATGLTLSAQKGDIAVRFQIPGKQDEESALAFRSTVLAELEARSDEPIVLGQVESGRGRASWVEGVVPRVWEFDTVTPDSVPAFPPILKRLLPFPDAFRRALADAAFATAKQNTRFALSRIQVRGKDGQLAATDGKQLLVQGGFDFPWQDDFLIPRLPALTRKGLLPDEPLHIGRTEKDLALCIGPWTFLLRIDSQSRFPSIRGVIPDPRGVTCKLVLHPKDSDLLAHALPKLPAGDESNFPVTLELSDPVILRARTGGADGVAEIELTNSRAEGNPTRLNVNRQYFARALALGFCQLEVIKPDQPVMCRDRERLYLWLPLDPKAALPPGGEAIRVAPENNNHVPITPELERREVIVPPNNRIPQEPEKPNGHSPAPPLTLEALLTEAEELRAVFHEAGGRLSRLLAGLKQFRRQNRVFEQAVASLRQLKLDR